MLLLTLGFPLALLGLLALMNWIEAPLRSDDSAAELPAYLDEAQPDEIETFVRNGFKTALDRYWMREGMKSRLGAVAGRRSDRVSRGASRRTLAHSREGGSGGPRSGAGTAVRGARRGLRDRVAVSRTDTSVPTR
jgi:hypothetical protein